MEDFDLSAYIGKQIKHLREKKGWTTQELADKLHTSRVTVTRYETGARKANQDMLYKICLLYTSPSPRDATLSRMPSSA